MKIRLSELRRIIRETLTQQGWPPGRWYPGTGEPVVDDEVHSMAHGGMGCGCEDECDCEERHEDTGL